MARAKWPKPARAFEVPLYGGQVYLFYTAEEIKQAFAWLKADYEVIPAAGRCAQVEAIDTDSVIYILGWHDEERATLVHEAVHLALFILKRAGIDVRDSNGEAMCYLVQDLVDRLGINDTRETKNG